MLIGIAFIGLLVFLGQVALRNHGGQFEVRRRVLARTFKALSGSTSHGNRSDGFAVSTSDGVRVNAMYAAWGSRECLNVTAEDSIPSDLMIGAEAVTSQLGKLLAGADVETGDEEFDRRVLLRGSEPRLLAILDHATRRLLGEAVANATTVSNGEVRGRLLTAHEEADAVIAFSRELATIARTISQRAQTPATLLAENVAQDPVPGVRRRSLEVLLHHFPGRAETMAALEKAITDADPEVRLFASSRLSEDGRGDEALAAIAGDPSLGDDVRADALRQFLAANPGSRGVAIAERLLADRHPALRTLAISAIGRARRNVSIATLVALAEKATDETERLALAEAFWRLRDPSAETVLVQMLVDGNDPLRIVAARALGRTGGVGAVEPLRRVQGLLAGELGRVAEEAIAAIQGRLRNASEGQLTVADSSKTEGQVSLSADRGAVSIPRKPPVGS